MLKVSFQAWPDVSVWAHSWDAIGSIDREQANVNCSSIFSSRMRRAPHASVIDAGISALADGIMVNEKKLIEMHEKLNYRDEQEL